MSHKISDWQAFLSFFQWKVDLILLKGYSRFNTSPDDVKRYSIAKTPQSFKKNELIAVKPDEVERYISEGHWIGAKIPEGFSLVDIDNEAAGKAMANSMQDNAIATI